MSKSSHTPRRRWQIFIIAMSLAMTAGGGCSKEEMKQALDSATEKTKSLTESAVEAVEDRLPETGSIQLEMDSANDPIKQASIEVVSIGDGRPNVVQIMTYDPSQSARSLPAVLLHGTTEATTVSSLAGETVQCDMYFQASPSSPIAITKPGQSVAVTFGQLSPEENTITANLGLANLVGSDDQPITIRGGEIIAVVREGK